MTEYGLIITFIAVLMMLVVAAVGQSVARTFDHASTVFANATGAPPTAP
jgi:Flp pilus assembly pilin Flp